jgi:hypothetical protein
MMHTQGDELAAVVQWHGQHSHQTSVHYTFIRGHLKTLVYKTTLETEADLLPHIHIACHDISHTPGILKHTIQSMLR